MSFQQWEISTENQIVESIDGVECGLNIGELCALDSNYKTEICETGQKFLYNTALTSEKIPIVFEVDGEAIGTIIISGHRPTCA